VFLLVELLFHLVEGVDVGFFELGGFGAGEAHGQEDEAVAGDAIHRASLVLFIFG